METTAGGDGVRAPRVPPPVPADGAVRHEDTLATILDATPVGVCITTDEGVFEQVNPAYERLYGYSASELVGRHFTMVVPEGQQEVLASLHDRFIAEGVEIRGEWKVVAKDGLERTILADACRIVGEDGRYRKVTFVLDISERIAVEERLAHSNELLEEANDRLAHLAAHDSLTGLANHRRSQEMLTAAVQTALRYRRQLAVAVIDLDHFKSVNDTHGHRIGDEVLVHFAGMLRVETRAADTSGRLGGEEFVLVMPETGSDQAAALVERLRVACRERVLTSAGVRVTFSAGIAQCTEDDTPESLLERADAALYRAKAAGRDRTARADAPAADTGD